MSAIAIDRLSKRYGAFTAVDQLSLTIGEGELFSLLGVNGAGKTTTIKILKARAPRFKAACKKIAGCRGEEKKRMGKAEEEGIAGPTPTDDNAAHALFYRPCAR